MQYNEKKTDRLNEHINRICRFMEKAGQTIRWKPTVPTYEERKLRAKLILEESLETIDALGFSVIVSGVDAKSHQLVELKEPNLVEIADGIADISVVSIGTTIACGIDIRPIIEMVDESNLAKFSEGSYRRDDGKWMKPPNWKPPRIKEELIRQGMKNE